MIQSKAAGGTVETLSPKYSCVPLSYLSFKLQRLYGKKKLSRIQCSFEFLVLFQKYRITNSLKTLALSEGGGGAGDASALRRSLSQPWPCPQLVRSHLPFPVPTSMSDLVQVMLLEQDSGVSFGKQAVRRERSLKILHRVNVG